MHRGKRVVAFTPFGRKPTVSILYCYLLREFKRGVLDEWMLCMNTKEQGQEWDIAYAEELAETHSWIKLYTLPGPDTPELWPQLPEHWRTEKDWLTPQMNTARFYLYMQDPGTVYLRFDDDIVWVHENTVRRLVEHQVERDAHTLATFPVIINNAICSWLLQERGCISTWGQRVERNVVDPIGWGDGDFAYRLHSKLLWHIQHGTVEEVLMFDEPYELDRRQQFSVSCFAIDGSEYARTSGILEWPEEEHWLTMYQTGIVDKSNWIVGDCMVSHLSFFKQRRFLAKTDILDRYTALAAQL